MTVLPTAGVAFALGVLVALAVAGPALRREHRLRVAAEYDALHDDLTRLPNRRALRAALLTTRRSQTRYGLVLLDLDNFKAINDTYGHPAGNAVLTVIAERLAARTSGPAVQAFRLSGDEFVLLVHGDRAQLRAAADTALRTIAAAPIAAERAVLSVTASAGYTEAPLGASDEHLLRLADAALYRAKNTQRGTVNGATTTSNPATAHDGPRLRDQRHPS